jgi:ATP-binding cassette subfamily B protein
VKGPFEALTRMPLPAIAHVRTTDGLGHFVVLHRVNKDSVVVADPARWVERLPQDDFCKRWTGYLLLVVPDLKESPSRVGAAPMGPWRRFLGLMQAHRGVLIEAFFCALLMTLLGVTTSYFVNGPTTS